MALETGTYISDLVATNPTSGDLKSQGDDHLRLIKATILASFPNITGAATLTHGQLSGVSTPFTGTPTAPTAAAGTNTTQIATTAFVTAAFVAEAYPPISGNSGKFLTTDGNITSWGDVYTESEVDATFALYYTKTEIDANTYTQTWIDANIYTQTEVDATFALYYTKTEIDANTYTQSQVDTIVAAKTITWEVVTSADTIAAGEGFLVNTTSASVSITLPAVAALDDIISIADYAGTFGTNNCRLLNNGLKILGIDDYLDLNIDNIPVDFVYSGATRGWVFR